MTAFDPDRPTMGYGQLAGLLTDGQTSGGRADELFLNMLDQYYRNGREGFRDHDGLVGELLDALNRHLNPIGLEATRGGMVYCNVSGSPSLHDEVDAVEAFMEEDWQRITQIHDVKNRPESASAKPEVFCTIQWRRDDILGAIEDACLPELGVRLDRDGPRAGQVEALIDQVIDAMGRDLQDRSIEAGWGVIANYMPDDVIKTAEMVFASNGRGRSAPDPADPTAIAGTDGNGFTL